MESKILIVEDSPTVRMDLVQALATAGLEAIPCSTAGEARQVLGREPVSLVILDALLPDADGVEFLKELRSADATAGVEVILLSTAAEVQDRVHGLPTRATEYVAKPYQSRDLVARAQALVRRRQVAEESSSIREQALRAALEAAEARAARKREELEAFTYTVSHDLRSPLRSIDGFSQVLLEDHAEPLGDEGRDCLLRIRGAAQRMNELIDDLLQLSRVGRSELDRVRLDLSGLARAIARELAEREPARPVELAIQPDVQVDADPQLLRVVLDNLLGNAWKFTAREAKPRIELGASAAAGGCTCWVRDNGVGLDMHDAGKKLFHPFQRCHHPSEFPGRGIGLAIVRRIIELHGGHVWAESAPGRGATIFFALPPAETEDP